LRKLRGVGDPALAYAEVELMASVVKAVYPIAEWANEVKFRV
jgi:hypothetical protein